MSVSQRCVCTMRDSKEQQQRQQHTPPPLILFFRFLGAFHFSSYVCTYTAAVYFGSCFYALQLLLIYTRSYHSLYNMLSSPYPALQSILAKEREREKAAVYTQNNKLASNNDNNNSRSVYTAQYITIMNARPKYSSLHHLGNGTAPSGRRYFTSVFHLRAHVQELIPFLGTVKRDTRSGTGPLYLFLVSL